MYKPAVLLIAASCIAIVSSTALAEITAPTVDRTFVQRHTVFPVLVTKDARVGGVGDARHAKKVDFELLDDVVIGGYAVARKGDLVEGHFTTERNQTHRMFSTDISQELALDIDDLVNFCGDTIHLSFERTFVGGARGGILSFGMHAHDAVFTKGLKLKAETDRPEKGICSVKTDAVQTPLPANLLLPDDQDPKSSNPSVNASPAP